MESSISSYKTSFPAKCDGWEGHYLYLVPSGWLPHRSITCVNIWWRTRKQLPTGAPRGPVPRLGPPEQWVLEVPGWAAGNSVPTLGHQCPAFPGIKCLGSSQLILHKIIEHRLVAERRVSPGHTPLWIPGAAKCLRQNPREAPLSGAC